MTNLPTVEEMQKWEKRYKLDDSGKAVIDTTDGGEYWTIHGNEAYNLCIDMNKLYEANMELKKENEDLEKEAEIYNEDAMSYQTLYEQQVEKNKKSNQLIKKIEDNLNRYKLINCLEYEDWKKEIWRSE